jgi:ketosteroid isomerase-like protein
VAVETIEDIRGIYDAFNEGDFDRALEAFSTEVVWSTPEDLPDAGTHLGIDSVRRLWTNWSESFDRLEVRPHELVQEGDEVIASVTLRGKIKGSGAPLPADR